MNNPKLSIIIPVYNAERYLSKTIQSVTQQKYSDWELILVDDGSKDQSLSECKRYAETDKRIRVFHKENSGVSDTRNFGLEKASGDFVYFMDSDDLIHPEFARIMMGLALKDDLDLVCCKYTTFVKKAEFSVIPEKYPITNLRVNNGDTYDILTKSGLGISIWSKIIRRELLLHYNIRFRSGMSYGEDMFVSWKCCLVAKKAEFVKLPLYYYRQTGNSAVAKYHKNLYESYRTAFDDVRDFVKEHSIAVKNFDQHFARYFAQQLSSFVRMEVRAPYGIKKKLQRLSSIVNDKDMQIGISQLSGKSALYDMANNKAVSRMLLWGMKNQCIEAAKNRIKALLQ